MKANWSPQPTDTRGLTRFKDKNSGAKAYIQRYEDGTVLARVQDGFFGRSTTLSEAAPAPADSAILGKLEETVYPPRYSDWKATDEAGVYEGESGWFGARAEISRDPGGQEASVSISSGPFGLGASTEAMFFAPLPSDQKMLEQLSR